MAGHQVALFRLRETDEVLAVDHRDPFSGANVMARGLVGSRGDIPTVASPVYKQTFDLRTGVCLDDDSAALGVWETRVNAGVVEVRSRRARRTTHDRARTGADRVSRADHRPTTRR